MNEPILRQADRDAWESWTEAARIHARSRSHLRRLDAAKRVVEEAMATTAPWVVMWSGGKDSTALTHLVCREMGYPVVVGSEKDDLDFPGEEEYVTGLAAQWGADLRILRPAVSAEAYLRSIAGDIPHAGDIHSRRAGLSKECFYSVVEAFSADYEGVFLGMRSEESDGRARNRYKRGLLYQKEKKPSGKQWVAQPLGDWTGIDVFAYLCSRDIPVLPVYQCIAFMHASEPFRIRKSWYVPGSHAARGGTAWLRHYFPSLFRKVESILPGSDLLV